MDVSSSHLLLYSLSATFAFYLDWLRGRHRLPSLSLWRKREEKMIDCIFLKKNLYLDILHILPSFSSIFFRLSMSDILLPHTISSL